MEIKQIDSSSREHVASPGQDKGNYDDGDLYSQDFEKSDSGEDNTSQDRYNIETDQGPSSTTRRLDPDTNRRSNSDTDNGSLIDDYSLDQFDSPEPVNEPDTHSYDKGYNTEQHSKTSVRSENSLEPLKSPVPSSQPVHPTSTEENHSRYLPTSPRSSESRSTDHSPTSPHSSESRSTEQLQSESRSMEQFQSESRFTEQLQSKSKPTEQLQSESRSTEQLQSESRSTEQLQSESRSTEHLLSEHLSPAPKVTQSVKSSVSSQRSNISSPTPVKSPQVSYTGSPEPTTTSQIPQVTSPQPVHQNPLSQSTGHNPPSEVQSPRDPYPSPRDPSPSPRDLDQSPIDPDSLKSNSKTTGPSKKKTHFVDNEQSAGDLHDVHGERSDVGLLRRRRSGNSRSPSRPASDNNVRHYTAMGVRDDDKQIKLDNVSLRSNSSRGSTGFLSSLLEYMSAKFIYETDPFEGTLRKCPKVTFLVTEKATSPVSIEILFGNTEKRALPSYYYTSTDKNSAKGSKRTTSGRSTSSHSNNEHKSYLSIDSPPNSSNGDIYHRDRDMEEFYLEEEEQSPSISKVQRKSKSPRRGRSTSRRQPEETLPDIYVSDHSLPASPKHGRGSAKRPITSSSTKTNKSLGLPGKPIKS